MSQFDRDFEAETNALITKVVAAFALAVLITMAPWCHMMDVRQERQDGIDSLIRHGMSREQATEIVDYPYD